MRRWPWSRLRGGPSPEAIHANREADRGQHDATAMHRKAQTAAAALMDTVRRNGFGEAVANAMRRE